MCSFFLLLSLDAQILIWKDGQVICQCDGYESFDSVTIMTVVEEPVIAEFESENTDYSESEEVVNDIVEEVVDYIEEEEVVNYDVDDDIDIEEDYYDNNITKEVLIGTINGLYSVSETNRVYFSQGNLRYHIEQNIWRFADTQYDIVGFENNRIGFEEVGWIDLFGWGTSGYNDVMPYLSVQDYTKYANVPSIAETNYDWGVYNKISNGGNEVGLWRTLTADEWMYLFFSRDNADSLFAFAVVNSVKGLILLPDEWHQPEGIDFFPSTTKGLMAEGKYFWNMASDNYEHNTYTKDQWAKMEEAGAVFLPAAGYRKGVEVEEFNEYGAYWTASGRIDNFAYRTIFYSSILSPGGSNITYYYGYSVRLVLSFSSIISNF